MKKPPAEQLTYPTWTDVLGQVYGPGDIVVVAVINNRSPQQVIGEVVQINRMRKNQWGTYTDEGGKTQHGPHWEMITKGYNDPQPSCTVRVQPLIDSRNFRRYSGGVGWFDSKTAQQAEVNKVTYQFPNNIIKLAMTREEVDRLRGCE